MAWITGSKIGSVFTAPLALSLMLTGAEAGGFGGGFHSGGVMPRVGAWGRPLGPVRPGFVPGGIAVRPGLVALYPRYHRPWRHAWSYGCGLGGIGLGFGLGSWFWDDAYPWSYVDEVYQPPIVVPPPTEVTIETEVVVADSAAVAACARRFKTYDPATQTYIGKGYVRRHCP
jgi:hypothetical protein